MHEKAQPLGLKKSFGFGDRLGLAGPGHLAAAKRYDYAPIAAQQSIREMTRTQRTPTDVMDAAKAALKAENYEGVWGADADHLKTREDVQVTFDAGFCFFTIDPSEFVNNAADNLPQADLEAEVAKQVTDHVYGGEDVCGLYEGKSFEIETGTLTFDRESLLRAAVKYGRAIAHCEKMSGWIAEINGTTPFEIEVSVDETDSPTAALEHLFFALELKRRNVTVVSLAPRFIGEMEKGIDYKGDLVAFEASLKEHVAIAKAFGPYKLSLHSGSDKLSIYPIFGRVCGDLIHVKTAGTSYLEALRTVCRVDTALFQEIIAYSCGRFPTDKATYHISATDADANRLGPADAPNLEATFLEEDIGRQILHVTFGSVLTQGTRPSGGTFKEAIFSLLQDRADLHREILDTHFTKHLAALTAG